MAESIADGIRRQLREHHHQQIDADGRPLGWFNNEEGAFYCAAVERHPKGVLVELGVHLGRSLSYVLESCRCLGFTVFAVDMWIDVVPDEIDERTHWRGGVHRWQRFNENLKAMGGEGYVNVLRMDSIDAANNFKNESVDVIFIDTLHTYEHTKGELEVWWPKLKHGGEMLGHDYNNANPGLVQAVDERFGKPDVVACGSMWLVEKHDPVPVLLTEGCVLN